LFLCHASDDKACAQALHARLTRLGFASWLDEKNLPGGSEFDRVIQSAIDESDFALVLFSKRFVRKDGYVQKELRMLLERASKKPPGVAYIIPLRIEPRDLPPGVQHLHAIDLLATDADQQLLRALHQG
jgi:hypothetical protein